MKPTDETVKGFSLIECLIALVVTMVGLLAVFQLVAYSVQIESFSYRTVEATALASNKIEELKIGTPTNGGSLTSNVTGYFDDTNPNYTVRWQVGDGAVGLETQHIAVEVFPKDSGVSHARVILETLIR
jgi:prepilin-type N-terminal cleavage/methylation domain-containing protein